ncbi:MAG: VirB6/TrbL-like conjugal transfer protein, CD1112 family [Negativibacillus sp.]
MQDILEQIEEWIKTFLIDCITGNLSGMFDSVNQKVGEIANEVGKTPGDWNSGVFSIIQNLAENVVIPIAGLILTFVLCYELISMIIEKNNLHGDFETFMLFKWIFKTFVAAYLVTHTFDIVVAVFELGQNVVHQSAALIGSDTALDFEVVMGGLMGELEAMEIGELFLLLIETSLIGLTMNALSICVMLVLVGRMIEIYSASRSAAFHPKAVCGHFGNPALASR